LGAILKRIKGREIIISTFEEGEKKTIGLLVSVELAREREG